MKKFDKQARQGDVLITKVDALPKGLEAAKPEGNEYIVTHSETGHHHVMAKQDVDMYQAANDPFIAYLVVNNETTLRHLRGFDTHETIKFNPGIYRINRQRQRGVEGWERVAD